MNRECAREREQNFATDGDSISNNFTGMCEILIIHRSARKTSQFINIPRRLFQRSFL